MSSKIVREVKAWGIVAKGLLQGKSLGDITYEQETEAARLRILGSNK